MTGWSTGNAILGLATLLQGQGQPIRLTMPDRRIDEAFSAIRGAREMGDGRLLVSDYRDERVVVIDFGRNTVTARVGRGGGPMEARLPGAVIAAPGDSSILHDIGNQRLLVLDPEGRPARVVSADRPGLMGLRGVDQRGQYYFAIPGWSEERPLPDDSVRVVRFDPKTTVQATVVVVQGERMRSDIRSPARVPRIPTVGYASRDGWLMSGDAVWIVRGGLYRVEIIRPDGAPIVGPSYRFDTRAVSAADRLDFVREFLTTSPTSGRGEGGGVMQHSPQPNEAEVRSFATGTQFAERHPMFRAGEILADGMGLWVRLNGRPGEPSRYDRFDNVGRRTGQVELLSERRVVTIGRNFVYVAHETEDGLQYLERYRRPPN